MLGATAPGAAEPLADIAALPSADVVILGEVHDNPQHHANQAQAVAALRPSALVFEMLTPAQAAAAMTVDRSDRAALEQATDWADSGWPEFGLYFQIFAAAPEAAIHGAALSRDRLAEAMRAGAAVVLQTPFPPLSDPEQAEREAMQAEAHCGALPVDMLPGMVEAQRLRDASLAQATIAAAVPDAGPVVVITGNGHARTDWGMPAYLALWAPALQVVSLGQLEQTPTERPPFDHWLQTDPAPRDDPCATFR